MLNSGKHFLLKDKTIFISALDWGLGHATRCVPVIRELKENNKIIIGVTPLTKIIFDEEFPDLQKIEVPAYNITYSTLFPLWFKLFLSAPRLFLIIKKEKAFLEKIIDEYKIEVVISDNRFGLHSKKVLSIFITHQLFLKTPFANSFAQNLNKKYILNFDEVWVPDFEDEKRSLSGELSHGTHFHKNVKYIGPQSRLTKEIQQKKYDGLFLISGPEPQQSILKNELLCLAEKNPRCKFALVSTQNTKQETRNTEIFICPDKVKLSELINQSETIFCRSGYSTLMDLHALKKRKIILTPTPGQTEQEYLAGYWQKKFGSIQLPQNKINTFNIK